jgi:hypothetical protein
MAFRRELLKVLPIKLGNGDQNWSELTYTKSMFRKTHLLLKSQKKYSPQNSRTVNNIKLMAAG